MELTTMASLTRASFAADIATAEVLCLEAAWAAANAAAFLPLFLPPAIRQVQQCYICL
jgi:hypothetical protein